MQGGRNVSDSVHEKSYVTNNETGKQHRIIEQMVKVPFYIQMTVLAFVTLSHDV